MKINDLLEKAGVKVTCGCDEESCSHCAGKHTVSEVGQTCKCCGNKIREVSIKEDATAGATSSGNIAAVVNPTYAHAKSKKKGKYGAPEAPQVKNSDGTAKNALDVKNNIMGSKPIKR
ncbi:MAG: hypothetical protein VW551_00685 [Euryarchaeota archaeon]|jgi:hypothetical protein